MPAPEDCRFPKSARLLTSREFQLVSSRGRRTSSRHFTVLIRDAQTEITRLGITVSRKVGNAVQRSRVKRVIRETFRLKRSRLKAGLDCVVIAKPQAGRTENAALFQDLRVLLGQQEVVIPD